MSEKLWRTAAIVWMISIFILSVMTAPSLPHSEWLGFDKIAHFGCYLLLTWLILGAWRNDFFSIQKKYIIVIICVSMYGVGIEFIQEFLPERYFEVPDIIANIIGSFAGVISYPLVSLVVKR
ncbi:MAG: VanZ family protein [Chitinophagales bacterium]